MSSGEDQADFAFAPGQDSDAGALTMDGAVTQFVPWVPSFGVNLSFYLDGLSLLFVLLITGLGTLVLLYASSYLKGHRDQGRFYLALLLFMSAMLEIRIFRVSPDGGVMMRACGLRWRKVLSPWKVQMGGK